jgi:hypothetical protein
MHEVLIALKAEISIPEQFRKLRDIKTSIINWNGIISLDSSKSSPIGYGAFGDVWKGSWLQDPLELSQRTPIVLKVSRLKTDEPQEKQKKVSKTDFVPH